jgi:hypothetical protein
LWSSPASSHFNSCRPNILFNILISKHPLTLIWDSNFHIHFKHKHRGLVVYTSSYLGCSGFRSRPGDWLSWLRFFAVFLGLFRRMLGCYLNSVATASFQTLFNSSVATCSFDANMFFLVIEKSSLN